MRSSCGRFVRTGGTGRESALMCSAGSATSSREFARLQQVGDKRRDRRTLRPRQRHVPEQAVSLERLDDRGDAVVTADAQVVALPDIVRANDGRAEERRGGEEGGRKGG